MKYELTETKQLPSGEEVRRIRSLRSFGDVKEGELGGWVETTENLSHSGVCWVYDQATVHGNSRIDGNAKVRDFAEVYGNSTVSGNAEVFGCAKVYGNARVQDCAKVYGYAEVSENAKLTEEARAFGRCEVRGDVELSGKFCLYGRAVVEEGLLTEKCFSKSPNGKRCISHFL